VSHQLTVILGLVSTRAVYWEINILQNRSRQCLQGHLGDTEIHIGVTELLGFLAVAMSYELGDSGGNGSVGPSWSLGFWHIWNEKVVEGFGAISLSIWASKPLSNTSSPFNSIGFPMDSMRSWITKTKMKSLELLPICALSILRGPHF
jgi:hypothetical protein